jgi:hypothetical protein
MADPGVVEIHQTLHGYSGGHRLLAASQRLPREGERALLMLTDLSGPVRAGAFDSYLTGCALPGTSTYALARTWLAPEFDRPGCVWSHTLLLDQADLARIPDLGVLRPLFTRPRKGEPWQAYGQRLTLSVAAPRADRPAAWSAIEAARLLAAFYGDPDGPTFVVAERPDTVEELVLALWTQQWPRLRRALRFCTWCLALRSIDGEPFDLQVVSPSVSREIPRTPVKAATVVIGSRPVADGPSSPVPSWAAAAAADLGESEGRLRQLLWTFGGGFAALRPVFAPLVEIDQQLARTREGQESMAALVAAVTARWPLAGEAKRLKAGLFGERGAAEPTLLPPAHEGDLLHALATTPQHVALNRDDLALRKRGGAFWRAEPARALALARAIVDAPEPSPLGQELLKGIAETLTPTDALTLKAQSPALFTGLVQHNPALATPVSAPPPVAPPAPSQAPAHEPSGLVAEPPRRPATVPAAPVVPAPSAPTRAPMAPEPPVAPPPGVVTASLDQLDEAGASNAGSQVDADWHRWLVSRPATVIGWLVRAPAPTPRTMLTIASSLDPHDAEVQRIGAEPWLRTTAGLEAKLDTAAYRRVAAFLLAVAFDNPGPGADELVVRAFATVDRAAASRELPLEAWRPLASRLPAVPRWRESDWCDRLRRGLVERFIRHGWPPAQLLRAVRDDLAFQRVVMICEWTEEGMALLKRLARELPGEAIETTRVQQVVLARYA